MLIQDEWTAAEACRLDVFLRERLPAALYGFPPPSNGKLRRLIVAGAVRVDGRQCRTPAFLLRAGSRVRVAVDTERFFFERQPDDRPFTLTAERVLYEDELLLVIDKPPFLPTEETIVQGRASAHAAAVAYLWSRDPSLRNPPYAGIMHRLDRETSGVLLFTKSRTANAAVHDMFEEHTARKTYRAVCPLPPGQSLAAGETLSVDCPMGRVSVRSARCKMGRCPPEQGGLAAHTDVTVAAVADGLCYLDCMPRTGRTHQIRFHLSQLGLPLAGDTLYGGNAGFAECGGRVMLHARALVFPHPADGHLVRVEAPYPAGFEPATAFYRKTY